MVSILQTLVAEIALLRCIQVAGSTGLLRPLLERRLERGGRGRKAPDDEGTFRAVSPALCFACDRKVTCPGAVFECFRLSHRGKSALPA